MTNTLLEVPLALLATVVVGLTLVTTLAGARVTAQRAGTRTNDSLGALHATISTIYTVLLAFVVVIVWQQFSEAAEHVETEATRLSNVLRDGRALGEPDRSALHDAVIRYVELTSTREWDAMSEGRLPDRATLAAYEQIWDVVYRIEPQGTSQEVFHTELVGRMNELGAARRTRLLTAGASVPPALWVLLLGGGALVLYVSYLLPTGPDQSGRSAALGATGCVIALTLLVIFLFDHPYTGSISVDPSPLTDLLSR